MSNKPQAVLLAAGKSTRVYPLTITLPKPLLPVANLPILTHNLDQLIGLVDDVIIIVGYKQEMIREYYGNNYKGLPLIFVEQKEQLGSGHAILQAEPYIRDHFVMMVGDDLCSRVDIETALSFRNSAAGKKVSNPSLFGVLMQKNNKLQKIVEKPQDFIGDLASTGLHSFDRQIFDCLKTIPLSPRGELEASDGTNLLAQKIDIHCFEIKGHWIPIGYPWDMLTANEFLLQSIKTDIQGEVEPGAILHGEVIIGKGTHVRSSAYIEGPTIIGENSLIASGTLIRASTSIGNNVIIGHGTEIKNSIIMDGAILNHGSYIGDSIIGRKVNIGCATVVANWRHDGNTIKSVIKSRLVDTGRQRFGTVIGDEACIAIKTGIYPGRKIWPFVKTYPGDIIRTDMTLIKVDQFND